MSLGTGVADGGGSGTTNTSGAGAGATGAGAGAPPPAAGAGAAVAAAGSGTGGGATGEGASKIGTGATGETSWRDSLPDELKSDPTLSKYSDINNLAKAHIEAQKLLGKKGIFKPGKDASPEEIKSFREAMGIPTVADKYDMGDFDKDIKVEQSLVDWAKKIGSEQGIEPSALKAIITDYMKQDAFVKVTNDKQRLDEVKKGFDGLRTEWGDAFDRNIQRANLTAEKMGGKALVDVLKKAGIDNNPVLLKAFAEGSKAYGEHTLREGGVGEGRQTPAELDAEISSVQGRLFSMKTTDGAYMGLKQRYESLWKQKTGGR